MGAVLLASPLLKCQPDLGGLLLTPRVPACSLELPEDKAKGKAARTLRLAVCQYYAPQAAAGPGAVAQLYLIKLDKPCRCDLEAEDTECIDCVLCHGKPKEPGHGKRKRAGQDHVVHPDAADVGKVYL